MTVWIWTAAEESGGQQPTDRTWIAADRFEKSLEQQKITMDSRSMVERHQQALAFYFVVGIELLVGDCGGPDP